MKLLWKLTVTPQAFPTANSKFSQKHEHGKNFVTLSWPLKLYAISLTIFWVIASLVSLFFRGLHSYMVDNNNIDALMWWHGQYSSSPGTGRGSRSRSHGQRSPRSSLRPRYQTPEHTCNKSWAVFFKRFFRGFFGPWIWIVIFLNVIFLTLILRMRNLTRTFGKI